jgi:threonine dehydrogenase-like Zn-dependent dehydrogenase
MQTNEALALWIAAPGRAELRREQVLRPRSDEALVRTLYSGISRGTESIVFRGEVSATERERMRAPFQSGDFPGPVKYGYSNVGIVEAGPESLIGKTVFCLYPHQTRYVVPADAVHIVPEGVPPARAVLAANLETALNGLWDATPRLGDRISVIGAGAVGCLVAWLAAQIAGCEVELIDSNREKASIAAALSIRFALPEAASEQSDVVIHASGAPDGLATALRLAGFEGTVVEMSWFGSQTVSLPLGEAFHAKRLTLRSSQVGVVAASQRTRWSARRRMALALRLLSDPRLDRLINGESAFDELPEVMGRLAAAPGNTICHRIVYD